MPARRYLYGPHSARPTKAGQVQNANLCGQVKGALTNGHRRIPVTAIRGLPGNVRKIFMAKFLTGAGKIGFFPPRASRKAPVAQLDRASDYESEG